MSTGHPPSFDALGDRSLEGRNLLVTGPPMSGKAPLTIDYLDGADQAMLVTTTRSAMRLLDGTPLSVGEVPIVDCTPGETPGRLVTNLGSPGDLTGISMPVSRFLSKADEPVLAFDSISSLLMYADDAPVFRFLSVLTSHVQNAGGTGLYTFDAECHDTETFHTIAQLFDGRIRLDESGAEAEFVGVSV